MPARPMARLLTAIAGGLAVAGVLAWLAGGIHFSLGWLRISAGDPSQVFFQAALVWVAAIAVSGPASVPASRLMAPLLAVLLCGVASSEPRRIGDGAEYMAMAISLSRGGAPALSSAERDAVAGELRARPALGYP